MMSGRGAVELQSNRSRIVVVITANAPFENSNAELTPRLPVSARTLLVGQQEGHPACKKAGCWFVGGDDLTGALHDCHHHLSGLADLNHGDLNH